MAKFFDKQIDKILREKHEKAIFLAESNLRRARRNKEFVETEKEEIEKVIALAMMMADEVDETKERIKLSEIRARKIIILKKLGLDEKDIKPQFECDLCEDTGFIDGKYCRCRTKILNEILSTRSGLTGELNDFSQAKFSRENTDAEKIFKLFKDWTDKFPNITKKMIYMTGATGVGKTFLLKCIANELIKKEVYIFYSTAFKMNGDFLEYCKARSDDKSSVLAPYLDSEILLIDDLGTEPILNNITLDYLYLILNERLISGKSTIINSNLDLEKLIDRYGERIFSRMINKRDGLTIKFEGEDLRLKKQ
ncbi:MAG: ATP-binding protein [Clostridia bacterium]|nr:ATP-binding protein [Clostridia bacterium]